MAVDLFSPPTTDIARPANSKFPPKECHKRVASSEPEHLSESLSEEHFTSTDAPEARKVTNISELFIHEYNIHAVTVSSSERDLTNGLID
jgi:hypothetical protein